MYNLKQFIIIMLVSSDLEPVFTKSLSCPCTFVNVALVTALTVFKHDFKYVNLKGGIQ